MLLRGNMTLKQFEKTYGKKDADSIRQWVKLLGVAGARTILVAAARGTCVSQFNKDRADVMRSMKG